MKQLHEYETPITNQCEKDMSGGGIIIKNKHVDAKVTASMEQRLACAVEALEEIEMKSENHFKAVAMAARALLIIKQ